MLHNSLVQHYAHGVFFVVLKNGIVQCRIIVYGAGIIMICFVIIFRTMLLFQSSTWKL